MAIVLLPKGRIPKRFEASLRTLGPISTPTYKNYAEMKITCDGLSPRPHGRNMYVYFDRREWENLKRMIAELVSK